MSLLNTAVNLLMGPPPGTTGYSISRSLRFNSSDSGFLSRTPGSAGNRRTWTWAGWVKRAKLGADLAIFSTSNGTGPVSRGSLHFLSTNAIRFWSNPSGSSETANFSSNAVFRDPSAWYHIVFALDTTQGASTERIKIYVNNERLTASSATYMSQNEDAAFNQAIGHFLGNYQNAEYGDFFLADVHFIDGQALTPSSFTEVSATTGQLIPKAYTGTFTGNSFWLKFSDNSSTTSGSNVGIGKDFSGLGNYWDSTNLSVAAGAGNDSLVDTPTSYGTDTGAGGEVRGNYCTLNPLKYGGDIQAPTNGNLDVTSVGSATGKILGTIGVSSGKWYWECVPNSSQNIAFGITKDNTVLANYPGQDAVDYTYHNDGNKYNNNSGSAYGASYTTNDVIGVAFDADNGTLTFYKNNSSQGQAYSGLTSGPYFPLVGDPSSVPDISATANFGQRPFAYTAPSGFKALCDTNLPTPVVAKPSTVFETTLYNGNNTTQTITGLAFSPDLVWIKRRPAAENHVITDTVRGASKALSSDLTAAEKIVNDFGLLTAFTSDGFTVTAGSTNPNWVNASGSNYAAWCWDAGTSTVTNTQGSITSSVRANASAGFSIVTYTGNGTSGATVGHGLNIAPQLLIVKRRSSAGTTANWAVWHGSLAAGQNLFLNTTDSASAYSPSRFTSTLPTSSVFSVGGGDETNYSTGTFVCYAFAPVTGYSSFGSYVGTGTGDGSFVYTGFRPRWIMVKSSDWAGGNWTIIDAARDTYNVTTKALLAENSAAEQNYSQGVFDILSNGFKVKYQFDSTNRASTTFVYAAFAESPFQYARAR